MGTSQQSEDQHGNDAEFTLGAVIKSSGRNLGLDTDMEPTSICDKRKVSVAHPSKDLVKDREETADDGGRAMPRLTQSPLL
jgi:hypothetical protein